MNGSIIAGGKNERGQLVVINSGEGEALWRAPWPGLWRGQRGAGGVCGRDLGIYVQKSVLWMIIVGVCIDVMEERVFFCVWVKRL